MWVFGYASLVWKTDFPYDRRIPCMITGVVRRFWQSSEDHRGIPGFPGRVATLIGTERAHELAKAGQRSKDEHVNMTPCSSSTSHPFNTTGEIITSNDLYSKNSQICWGMAYHVPDHMEEEVRKYLDHREQGGYDVLKVQVFHPVLRDCPRGTLSCCNCTCSKCTGKLFPDYTENGDNDVLVYVGTEDNVEFSGPSPPSKDFESLNRFPSQLLFESINENIPKLNVEELSDIQLFNEAFHILHSCGPSGPNADYVLSLNEALLYIENSLDHNDDHLKKMHGDYYLTTLSKCIRDLSINRIKNNLNSIDSPDNNNLIKNIKMKNSDGEVINREICINPYTNFSNISDFNNHINQLKTNVINGLADASLKTNEIRDIAKSLHLKHLEYNKHDICICK